MEELKLPTIFITHDVDEAILLADRIAILSKKTISDVIPIENRPQKTNEYLLTEEFLTYKRRIVNLI
jgi:ABC-type nitrate/sulfonate/bicarbonate transport system ATPase subunit